MSYTEKIFIATESCESRYVEHKSNKFLKIYPFATENISGYINLFELKDKKLLTVGSSLDQVISASMFDCKEITIVDINPFIKEYYYLKKAALMTLSRKEFCEFLCYNDYPEVFEKNENVLSKQTYYKIRDYLRLIDYESYLFWDELINLYAGNKIRLRLFSMDEDQYKIQTKKIPYLKDDESYEKAKEKLKNTKVNFITEDINDIELYEQYDNIFLSNIADYQKREKTKQLLDKLLPNIKDNGKIMITYMYETEETTKYQKEWSEIYDLEKTLPLFEKSKLESFQGVRGLIHNTEKIKDSVLTYQKIKK